MHFESFDGDGANDYAHPNYDNMEGLSGIILHELGHLTEGGQQSWIRNAFQGAREGLHGEEYNYSAYWLNNEAYANDFSESVAAAFGVDVDTWNPAEGTVWVSPNVLYEQRNGGGGGAAAAAPNGWFGSDTNSVGDHYSSGAASLLSENFFG